MTLLSISSDAKTTKGLKLGFLTGILYLTPSDLSGYQVCPMAKLADCENGCLFSAGRGAFSSVQLARLSKTDWFFNSRDTFMLELIDSIKSLVKRANRENLIPLVRLNGTSDIRWESIPVTVSDVTYSNIFALFPDVQFYDYTKLANRKGVPSNYDLTFSYSGSLGYQKYVKQAIDAGLRIAVVFRTKNDIPQSFLGLPVVNGDDSDVRHLDKQGVIVALYAKGKAKTDTGSFVVDTLKRVIQIKLAA
jgi:hypothetical protein